MSSNKPQRPLITVLGATGTGKSQLAVELSCRFNGEIINGDAMQLYDGLPIITNKIPIDERKDIPHHLLGCVDLKEESWDVERFNSKAREIMDDIYRRNKIPILVGGTHYYTQAMLFPQFSLVGPRNPDPEINDISTPPVDREQWPILDQSTEIILEKLREVDPVMANRWHPNDRRKIQRSLEIYITTGKKASEIYESQASERLKSSMGEGNAKKEGDPATPIAEAKSQMSFQTILFWVHCETEVLRERLDSRVDKMVAQGLVDEVKTLDAFREAQERVNAPPDLTRGIWQSIGYRQFHPFTQAEKSSEISPEELAEIKFKATEEVKAATRQYAKRQIRWIRIKLLNALQDAGSLEKVFLVDSSDLSTWEDNVVAPAMRLTSLFLEGSQLPDPKSLSSVAAETLVPKREYDMSQRQDLWQQQTCDICNVTVVTEEQWSLHMKSQRHHRTKRARLKKQQQQANREKKGVPPPDSAESLS